MKKYVIDELQSSERSKLKDYLTVHLHASGVEDIFWLFLDGGVLNEIQKQHTECHPYYFAVELTQTAMHCELLVRSNTRLRCDCINYAEKQQRQWAIDRVEAILKTLTILA